MKFRDCHLNAPILKALAEQGYTEPTAIQAGAIPPALSGRDVLGCARTGTGKTCAFATPILQRLSEHPTEGHPIRALVLTPTRELAIQNQTCFEAYGKYVSLNSVVIFGGVGQQPQVDALKAGADILVATPGRLVDLYDQGYLDFSRLEIFVLDEADRMLDMGFLHDVKKILKWLPKKKQTLFFSATMPPEITDLVAKLLHHPVRVAVDPVNTTVDTIRQRLYKVDRENKSKLLISLLKDPSLTSVLVFTRTKHGANKVSRDLEKKGIPSAAIHGNKSQTARQEALAGFKAGDIRVLVATDIAARGLDIENLSCVVNYNLPDVPETYVHRIGRTGRAGKGGLALSLCDVNELPLLGEIEKFTHSTIPEVKDHPFPMVQLEPTPRDKHGRVRNLEDEEARAAAREQNRQRHPETPTAQESTGKGSQKKGKKQAKGTLSPQEVPAQSQRHSKKKGKKAAHGEGAGVVPIPDLLPPRREEAPAVEQKFDSKDILHRTYKRPERKVIPSLANVSLLPTVELKESFGSGLRLDGDLSSHKGDATSRMFSTRKEIPEQFREKGAKAKKGHTQEEDRPSKGRKKQGKQGKNAPEASRPAPEEQAKKPVKQEKKGKKGEKKGTAKAAQSSAKKDKSAQVRNKKKQPEVTLSGGKKARPPRMPERPDRQKDSTQHKSLMKPYYLSDFHRKG